MKIYNRYLRGYYTKKETMPDLVQGAEENVSPDFPEEVDQDQDGMDMDQLDGGGCWQLIGQKSAKSLMMQKTVVEGTEDDELMKKNPIQVSVLQGHARCSKMLHRFGWRIPQVTTVHLT